MDAPKIPTLKDSQKPQVKVRGLEAGVTLFDRLKQFKKKDLAFILAGLGTLFMAPLAEHFMMAPEQASDMTPGMGSKGGGSGLFNGNGSGPYEPGNTGLAAGNPAGGSLSDIITPLNVRDPSALVMGPGATQQPPTQSAAPATPPPTAPVSRNDSDLKDALAASGARAAGAASKAAKALLPVPKIALGGAGGLRGLGVTSGGSSASGGLAPISAANVSNKASTGGGLSPVKALPGYRGAASGRGQGQGGSGMEALKAAADKQGNVMNQGSASTALDQAAAQQIPGGGAGMGGSGQGGTGATDKGGSGNQDKSSKNVGESLDFLKQKAIQEKKIELWAKEQEANDMNLLMAQTRNEAIKSIVGAMAKSLGDCAGKLVVGGACSDIPPGASGWRCGTMTGGGQPDFPGAKVANGVSGCNSSSKDGVKEFWIDKGSGKMYRCPDMSQQVGQGCIPNGPGAVPGGGDGDGKKPGQSVGSTGNLPSGTAGVPTDQVTALKSLGTSCAGIKQALNGLNAASAATANITTVKTYLEAVYKNAGIMAAKRDVLFNGQTSDCDSGAIVPDLKTKPVTVSQQEVVTTLTGPLGGPGKDAPMAAMIGAASQLDAKTVPYDKIAAAETALTAARTTLDKLSSSLPKADPKGSEAFPVTEISAQFPGKNSEVLGLQKNVQSIQAADLQLATIQKTATDVQTQLEASVPKVREVSGKAAGEGTLGKVVQTNSGLNDKVIQPVQNKVGDGSITVKEVAKPDYSAMNAPDAKNPPVGKVGEDTEAAGTAVKAGGTAVEAYTGLSGQERLAKKDETQTAVNAASDAVSKMRNTQAGVINGLDKDIRAQGDRLRSGNAGGTPAN